MDNCASSYRRFLEGDRNSFTELVKEYWDGLTLYLNSFAESIAEASLKGLHYKSAVLTVRR